MRSTDPSLAPVALIYQSQPAQQHLLEALSSAGVQVVYHEIIRQADGGALLRSGARIVIVNLDADEEASLDHLEEAFADPGVQVLYNESEVSSRLQGWDQSRWLRHLVAKVAGGSEVHPPRPAGAQAVPEPGFLRSDAHAEPQMNFESRRAELEEALRADTRDSLDRARAALVTPEEPIAPQMLNHFHQAAPEPVRASEQRPTAGAEGPLDAISEEAADGERVAEAGDGSLPPLSFSDLEQELARWHAPVSAEGDQASEEQLGPDAIAEESIESIEVDSDYDFLAASDQGGVQEGEGVAADLQWSDEFASELGDIVFEDFEAGAQDAPPRRIPDEAPASGLDDMLKGLAPPVVKEPLSLPANANKPKAEEKVEAKPVRNVQQMDLSHLSLAPLEEEEASSAPAGRARFDAPKASENPTGPAPKAPAAHLLFETRLSLMDYDEEPLAQSVQPRVTVASEAQPGTAVIGDVWVLGGSIGAPEAIKTFLSALSPGLPVLFVLAQHMGDDFFEVMTQQFARATSLPLRTVAQGDRVRPGEVVVAPLLERLRVDAQGLVSLEPGEHAEAHTPSIDQVVRDVADAFGTRAGLVVFSGMAQDALEGALYLKQKGGTVWVQDPASCVIGAMPEAVLETGIPVFSGTPEALAKRFLERFAP